MNQRLTNYFLPPNLNEDQLRHARYTIHSYLIMGMSCFSFMLLNIYLQLDLLTYTTGLIWIGSIGCLYLVKFSFRLTSIILAQIQVVGSIFLIGYYYTAATMVHVHLLPAFICLFVSLNKHERKYAYLYTFSILLLVSWVFISGFNYSGQILSPEMLQIEWCVNLLGTTFIILYYIITLLRINDAQLIELEKQNTNLQEQNILLDESIHSRDRLVSVMSHDLRSPLASVIMTMEMMLEKEVDVRKLTIFLHRLHSNCTNTLHMLDEVLDWIRNQNEQIEFNPVAWCNDHFERSVLIPARDIAENKKITINFENKANTEVIADRRMIDCILRNLISNAIKFSYPNAQIHVGLEDSHKGPRLYVRDEGKGMKADEIQALIRGKSFTTKGTENEKGIGLGMVLVREFLNRHGSQLEISSMPGQGSEFHFTLATAKG